MTTTNDYFLDDIRGRAFKLLHNKKVKLYSLEALVGRAFSEELKNLRESITKEDLDAIVSDLKRSK